MSLHGEQARAYTIGWRARRDGLPCPSEKYAEAGWKQADSAIRHGRSIEWSRGDGVAVDVGERMGEGSKCG